MVGKAVGVGGKSNLETTLEQSSTSFKVGASEMPEGKRN